MQGLPLEEVAAIFGDADEVALYQRDLEIDVTTHEIKSSRLQPESASDEKGVREIEDKSEVLDRSGDGSLR